MAALSIFISWYGKLVVLGMKILVVGAGFAGGVHARELADAGYLVHVIDRCSHIAGHCFDYVHESGVRVHRYGPHLFHTSNTRVVAWLSRFTEWLPYEHRVVARLADGRHLPIPINIDSVNALFGLKLSSADEMAAHLKSVSQPRDPIASAEDYLYSRLGPELTNLFFRPYTKKMYGTDLADINASVVRRLQIRGDKEDRYFPNDAFQALPRDGYTVLFERIFDHPNISIELDCEFERAMLNSYDHCFNSMPIDHFFHSDLGELPYRSTRFHSTTEAGDVRSTHVSIDYTDASPFIREIWWHNLPGHHVHPGKIVVRTIEEPCDYRDNNLERHFPVKTPDGRFDTRYKQYKERAAAFKNLTFIGRCGTYQYLDMHQVVNQSLANAAKWRAAFGSGMARDGSNSDR